MSEYSGNLYGANENMCITASRGRNFIPIESDWLTEGRARLIMALDVLSVLAFIVLVVVLSL